MVIDMGHYTHDKQKKNSGHHALEVPEYRERESIRPVPMTTVIVNDRELYFHKSTVDIYKLYLYTHVLLTYSKRVLTIKFINSKNDDVSNAHRLYKKKSLAVAIQSFLVNHKVTIDKPKKFLLNKNHDTFHIHLGKGINITKEIS